MGDSLMVNTERLSECGNYFVSSVATLDAKLSSLDTKMSVITNNWLDEGGSIFKSEFSKFITEAKKINVEIEKLGTYASDMSDRYDTILQEHYARME